MYNCLHLLIPNSQSISPPPTSPLATKSLFSMSVSLFLFCSRVHLCHILGSTYKWYYMVSVFLFKTTMDQFAITSTDPETWPRAGTTILGMSIFYMSITLYRQPTKLLSGEVPWSFITLSNWLYHCCGIFLACGQKKYKNKQTKKKWPGQHCHCLELVSLSRMVCVHTWWVYECIILLNHMRIQVTILSPQPRGLNKWFRSWAYGGKIIT